MQGVCVAKSGKQAQRLFMHRQRFAVHIGHVGKVALRIRQPRIIAPRHQLLRKRQSQRIFREMLLVGEFGESEVEDGGGLHRKSNFEAKVHRGAVIFGCKRSI